jgi:TRAP transporter TAXI family solute receptor
MMERWALRKSFVFALLLPMFLVLAAGQVNAATKYIVFGGGGTGGTFFLVASGMANLAQKYIPDVNATSEITAGSVENCKRLARGQETFALVSDETGYHAYRKTREFVGSTDKLEDLRLVIYGYLSTLHIFVNADSPIHSVADFKGKKIAVAIGPVAQVRWPAIARAYNLKETDYSQVVLRPAEQMNSLRDGNTDAVVFWGGEPTVAVTDLATTKKIRFIDLGDRESQLITKEYPYFRPSELDANMYPGQTAPVKTLKHSITVATNASVDPDLVYQFIDAILTHNDELKQVHPAAADFNKKNAVGKELFPYHPGAIKYYKEHGMMK